VLASLALLFVLASLALLLCSLRSPFSCAGFARPSFVLATLALTCIFQEKATSATSTEGTTIAGSGDVGSPASNSSGTSGSSLQIMTSGFSSSFPVCEQCEASERKELALEAGVVRVMG
jgi:hypothetical protein